jgi:molybdopterin converting factor small subunit
LPDQTLEAIIIYGSMFFQGSGPSMEIAVELFGIPRARAGTAHTTAAGTNLGEVLFDLAARYPALAATCIDGRELREGFIANLGAEQFVTSPETPLNEGDTLLLLSIDAGG